MYLWIWRNLFRKNLSELSNRIDPALKYLQKFLKYYQNRFLEKALKEFLEKAQEKL